MKLKPIFYSLFFCDQIVSMVCGSQLINSAKQVTLMPTPLWPRHPTSTSGSMGSWSLSKGESIALWSHWLFNSSSVMLRMKKLGFEKRNPSWLQIIEVETSLEFRLVLFGASEWKKPQLLKDKFTRNFRTIISWMVKQLGQSCQRMRIALRQTESWWWTSLNKVYLFNLTQYTDSRKGITEQGLPFKFNPIY